MKFLREVLVASVFVWTCLLPEATAVQIETSLSVSDQLASSNMGIDEEQEVRFKEDVDFWSLYIDTMEASIVPQPTQQPPKPTQPPPSKPNPRPSPGPVQKPTPRPPSKTPRPSPRPTQKPTQPPLSPRPTSNPTQLPPSSPVSRPSPPAPTRIPSSDSNPRPNQAPVRPPAFEPSNPTPINCESEAFIDCVDQNGESCFDLEAPPGPCDSGEPLTSLRFRLEFCTCEESQNSQDDFLSTCNDEAQLPSSDTESSVRVTCVDAENENLLFSDTIRAGDTITLRVSDNNLPDAVSCSIFSTEGFLIQAFTLNTSGQEDLHLTDKFASLSLEACDDSDCIAEVTYTYTVENTGAVPITLTKFEVSRNGDREDLLDEASVTNIPPGSFSSASETETVDLCVADDYFTIIDVVGEPPNGDECPAQADFFFEILDGCLVDVQISCKAPDGTECINLEPPENEEDCSQEVTYEYKLENVGPGTMDITTVERTRNDETVSLMESLEVTSLSPGESTVVVEKETIDTCTEAEFSTDVIVEADPPNDIQCANEDSYAFSISAPCAISVDLTCASVDGTDCQTLKGEQNPTCNCGGGCVQTLVYKYTAARCSEGSNGCGDSGISNGLTADITIADGSNVIFFQGRVSVGDEIKIEKDGDCLPGSLFALVGLADQPPTQTVVIDSSCTGGVNLLDDFGAFEFAGYTCPDGIPRSCYADVEYTITTINEGTTSQTITDWIFEINGEIRGPGMELPVLEPNDSYGKVEPGEIELCVANEVEATVTVVTTGDAPDQLCEGNDRVTFSIEPGEPSPLPAPTGLPPSTELPPSPVGPAPTEMPPLVGPAPTGTPPSVEPAPTGLPPSPFPFPTFLPPGISDECKFEMEIECVPLEGAASCNATPPPVEQCEGRPFEMGFLFNGGDCYQSFNVQEDKFFCNDFGDGPPTERGEKAYIIVTDLKNEIVYHQDWVEVGDIFTLSDGGERFEANQLITIYKSESTEDPANILQSVQYHSSCSSNLFLKDRFGASQLVLWTNEDQGTISCFANQTFNLDIEIPIDLKGGPATVTGLTVASNVDPFFFNLTDKVYGIETNGGDTVATSLTIPIDLTERKVYTLLITLTAVTSTGVTCTASDLVSFTAGYPLPPIFPTFAPTTSPGR